MANSKPPVARKPFWAAVAAAGVFTIILSFPKRTTTESESTVENPEARAEELINGLLARLGSDPVADTAPPLPAVPVPAAAARDLFRPDDSRPAISPTAEPGAPRPARRMPRLPSLGGLLTDGGRRLAMLNGKAVGVGEEVNGYRVKGIEDDSVVLEWRGRTKRIRWKE